MIISFYHYCNSSFALRKFETYIACHQFVLCLATLIVQIPCRIHLFPDFLTLAYGKDVHSSPFPFSGGIHDNGNKLPFWYQGPNHKLTQNS